MDFLDPNKRRAHRIRLMVGYALLSVAVVLAATVLLYQAHGFGVKQGRVIQNGLVFVNSAPGPASIDLNGRRVDSTNARLVLEAGSYTMRLSRNGYHDWQRALTVEGGSVEHFAYPLLVPRELKQTAIGTYQAAPALVTQSPDRRWLLVQPAGQTGAFDVYDTDDPEQLPPPKQTVAIPATAFTRPVNGSNGSQPLEVVEWSNDNVHLLLRHGSGAEAEYIVFNHRKPAESVNLTRTLQLTPNLVPSLQDKKYDRYFIHDTIAKTLSVVTLKAPQGVALLNGVLAFKAYGNDVVLYTSPLPSVAGQPDKVQLKLFQDKKQLNLRTMAAHETYLLGLSRFDGDWLAMAGVPSENRVYIYRDPADALRREPNRAPVPAAVLKVSNPAAVSFSANSQLMMAYAPVPDGSGVDFAVYDAEYDRSHTYRMDAPFDAPQTKALWVDSHHLQYVSRGKVLMFDYDGTNRHELGVQTPGLPALFDTGYVSVFSVSPAAAGTVLNSTSLRLPADL